MSPVSIETPGKHQDHVSCTQETYSYWNGWCSRTLSNFDNLPLSQPARSPKGVIDAIMFWSLLMVSRQPSSFWALQTCRLIFVQSSKGNQDPNFQGAQGLGVLQELLKLPLLTGYREPRADSQKPSYPSMLEQSRTCSSITRCCAAAVNCCR